MPQPKVNSWPETVSIGAISFNRTTRVVSIDPADASDEEPSSARAQMSPGSEQLALSQPSLVAVVKSNGSLEWWRGPLRGFDEHKQIVSEEDAVVEAENVGSFFIRKGHSYKHYVRVEGAGAPAATKPVVPPLIIKAPDSSPSNRHLEAGTANHNNSSSSSKPAIAEACGNAVSPHAQNRGAVAQQRVQPSQKLGGGGASKPTAAVACPESIEFPTGLICVRGPRVINVDPEIETDAAADPEREKVETVPSIVVMRDESSAAGAFLFYKAKLRGFETSKVGISGTAAVEMLTADPSLAVFFKLRNSFRMFKRSVSENGSSKPTGDTGDIGVIPMSSATIEAAKESARNKAASLPTEAEKCHSDARKRAFSAIGELSVDSLSEFCTAKKSAIVSLVAAGTLIVLEEPESNWTFEHLCTILREFEADDRKEQQANGDLQPTCTFAFRLQKCVRNDLAKKIDVSALRELVGDKKFDIKAAQKKARAAGSLARFVQALHDLCAAPR